MQRKSQLIGKYPDAGKDWRQEKGAIEDEMVGWHHQLNGHEFEQTLGIVKGRETWHAAVHGVAGSDTTEWLKWTEREYKKKTTFSVEGKKKKPSRNTLHNGWFRGNPCMCIHLLQLCTTLCNPVDCTPPGSSVLGILQARILEWVAMPSSRGYSHPKDRTSVCLLQRWVLYHSLCHLGGNPTDHINEFLWKNLVRKHPYTHT